MMAGLKVMNFLIEIYASLSIIQFGSRFFYFLISSKFFKDMICPRSLFHVMTMFFQLFLLLFSIFRLIKVPGYR